MDKILKQMQQMSADLTANMNAKFEQITANAEINIAELKSNIEAVSYTHLCDIMITEKGQYWAHIGRNTW